MKKPVKILAVQSVLVVVTISAPAKASAIETPTIPTDIYEILLLSARDDIEALESRLRTDHSAVKTSSSVDQIYDLPLNSSSCLSSDSFLNSSYGAMATGHFEPGLVATAEYPSTTVQLFATDPSRKCATSIRVRTHSGKKSVRTFKASSGAHVSVLYPQNIRKAMLSGELRKLTSTKRRARTILPREILTPIAWRMEFYFDNEVKDVKIAFDTQNHCIKMSDLIRGMNVVAGTNWIGSKSFILSTRKSPVYLYSDITRPTCLGAIAGL